MGMPVSGLAMPPPQDEPRLSWTKLIRWSLIVVGGAAGAFVLATALETLRKLLLQFSARLLGGLLSALKGGPTLTATIGDDALLFAAVGVLLILLQFAGQYAAVWSDTEMVRRLQKRLHDTLLALGPEYHDRYDLGRTNMIVMQFASGVQPALKQLASFPIIDGISLIAALWLLFDQFSTLAAMPPTLAAGLGAVLLLLPVAGWWLAGRVGRASAANIRARQALNTEFINSATAPAEVRLMGAEAQRSRAFARSLDEAIRTQRRTTIALQIARQFQEAVPNLLQTVFVIYAVFVVLATGSAEIGAIVTILLLVPQVVGPIQEVIGFLTGLTANWPLIAEVGELLDAKPERQPGTAPFPDGAAAPLVRFDKVSFAYPGRPPVLRGLTHDFAPGRTTAIIGRSGSGKSSILALIAGTRHADAGLVTIDGTEISTIAPAALHAGAVMVSQFPLFITGTVRANFQLGHDAATDAEIEAAAGLTGLWPVLERNQPQAPLEAPMGASGAGFSGGERRLFAITRALLRCPRILLLDEPTTGIDAIAVEALERCIRGIRAGLSVIMVEHHLEFAGRLADEICCLEDGVFTAIGAPADLAARPGLYATLLAARRGIDLDQMEIESVPMPRLGRSPGAAPGIPTGIPLGLPIGGRLGGRAKS